MPFTWGWCTLSTRMRSSSIRRSAALRASFSECTSLSSSSASARLMRSTFTILFALSAMNKVSKEKTGKKGQENHELLRTKLGSGSRARSPVLSFHVRSSPTCVSRPRVVCAALQAHHWPAAAGRARVTMRMSSGPMRDVICVAAAMLGEGSSGGALVLIARCLHCIKVIIYMVDTVDSGE
jgi:hypothetical protein